MSYRNRPAFREHCAFSLEFLLLNLSFWLAERSRDWAVNGFTLLERNGREKNDKQVNC